MPTTAPKALATEICGTTINDLIKAGMKAGIANLGDLGITTACGAPGKVPSTVCLAITRNGKGAATGLVLRGCERPATQ